MQNALYRLFSSNGRKNTYAALVAIITLWFLGHPYFGLYHDARLYTAQALAYLQPNAYANDLFFLYGSQNKYTIFTALYAQAIHYFGLELTVLTLTWLGLALWFAGSVFLLSRFLSQLIFWLALFLITVLPDSYGSAYIFSYAEPFLTPRLFAEAIVLFSIGLAVQERWWQSGLLLLIAAMLHPLMALSGGLLLFCYRPLIKRVLINIVISIGIVVLLAIIDIEPFNHLFLVMDQQWYSLVMARSPYLTLASWKTVDWMPVLIEFCILLCAVQSASGQFRRLFLAVLITTLVALLLCVLGDLLLHNALLIQLQFWRVLWLTQWFSYVALAWLMGSCANSKFARAIILVLVSAWLLREHNGGLIALLAASAWTWQIHYAPQLQISKLIWISAWLLFIQALCWFMLNVHIDYQIISGAFSTIDAWPYSFHRAGEGVLLIPIFFLLRQLLIQSRIQQYSGLMLLIALSMLSATLLTWDKRQPVLFPRAEHAPDEFAQFRRLIPETAVVYWVANESLEPLMRTWLLLGRSHYFSKPQSAGVVFNRETALEAKRRAELVLALNIQDSQVMTQQSLRADIEPHVKIDRAGLTQVCQDPHLDFVIVLKAIPGVTPVAEQQERDNHLHDYLYACQSLRSSL